MQPRARLVVRVVHLAPLEGQQDLIRRDGRPKVLPLQEFVVALALKHNHIVRNLYKIYKLFRLWVN
jgi:hypothetical protein